MRATGALWAIAGVEAGVSVGGLAGEVFGDAISTSARGAAPCASSVLADAAAAARVLAVAAPLPLPRPRPRVVGAAFGGIFGIYPSILRFCVVVCGERCDFYAIVGGELRVDGWILKFAMTAGARWGTIERELFEQGSMS
jgi:hypothetical protein